MFIPSFMGFDKAGFGTPKLLDLYPNAAAAYSVRLLRTLYTGNAIRVRRTDLTEANIGFTSAGNLDTTALLAFTGTGALDNGFITTWYDQSGNARNATQTTALNQPQIVSSGSILNVNAKPSLKFDGSNDIMKFIGSGTSSSNTLFVLSKCNNLTPSYQTITSIGSIQPSTAFTYMYFGAAPIDSRAIYSDVIISHDGARTTSQELVAINAASSSISMFVNNSSVSLTNNTRTLTTNLNDLQIGNDTQYSDPYNGNIQEIVLYTTAQTSNVSGINTNINTYYAIY
jgi:hypothetical protein